MEQKTVYALGFFDGVHMGHGALLRACRELSGANGLTPGAVTFSSHPEALVCGNAPGLLTTAADREMLMRRLYGIERILVFPFDRQLMNMSWRTFFQMLRSKYGAAGFVCGHDFRFGRRGEGTPALLKQAAEEAGLPCLVVPEQKIEDITVSSTYIRSLLEEGDMERAALFLGHPHIFSGTVVPGNHLGSRLGFPTANLLPPDTLLTPRRGVYCCKAWVNGESYPAVTNIGTRPTVGGDYVTVESWLLGFSGDLYGQKITLEFHKYLRPEKKYGSLEELRTEIQKNAAQTLEFFNKK